MSFEHSSIANEGLYFSPDVSGLIFELIIRRKRSSPVQEGRKGKHTQSVLPATAKVCGATVLTLNEYRSTPLGARNSGSGHSLLH